MKSIVLMLCGCMLFTSLTFAQQDSTRTDGRSKSSKKHNSSNSQNSNKATKDSMKVKSNKKGGTHRNMDSTATMGQ